MQSGDGGGGGPVAAITMVHGDGDGRGAVNGGSFGDGHGDYSSGDCNGGISERACSRSNVGTIELIKDVILLLRFFKLPSSLMIID